MILAVPDKKHKIKTHHISNNKSSLNDRLGLFQNKKQTTKIIINERFPVHLKK